MRSGAGPSDITILVWDHGGKPILDGSDWPLDSLRTHDAARTAYRLTSDKDKVRVEGREAGRKCLFESCSPKRAARMLLGTA